MQTSEENKPQAYPQMQKIWQNPTDINNTNSQKKRANIELGKVSTSTWLAKDWNSYLMLGIKTRMSSCSTFVQCCAENSSQCNEARRQKEHSLWKEEITLSLFSDDTIIRIMHKNYHRTNKLQNTRESYQIFPPKYQQGHKNTQIEINCI